ncbi:MAG: hypothetical protein ACK5Z5_01445 [Neisseriaceae bacterium]
MYVSSNSLKFPKTFQNNVNATAQMQSQPISGTMFPPDIMELQSHQIITLNIKLPLDKYHPYENSWLIKADATEIIQNYGKSFESLMGIKLTDHLAKYPTIIYFHGTYLHGNDDMLPLLHCNILVNKEDTELRHKARHFSIIIQKGVTLKGQFIDVMSMVGVNFAETDKDKSDCNRLGIDSTDPKSIKEKYKAKFDLLLLAVIKNGNKHLIMTPLGMGLFTNQDPTKNGAILDAFIEVIREHGQLISNIKLKISFSAFKGEYTEKFSGTIINTLNGDIVQYFNHIKTEDEVVIVNPSNFKQNGGHYISRPDERAMETTLFTNILIVPYDVIHTVASNTINCEKLIFPSEIRNLNKCIPIAKSWLIDHRGSFNDYIIGFYNIVGKNLSDYLEENPTILYYDGNYVNNNNILPYLNSNILINEENTKTEIWHKARHFSAIIQSGITQNSQHIDVISIPGIDLVKRAYHANDTETDCFRLGVKHDNPQTIRSIYTKIFSLIIDAAIYKGNKHLIMTPVGMGMLTGHHLPTNNIILDAFFSVVELNAQLIEFNQLTIYFSDYDDKYKEKLNKFAKFGIKCIFGDIIRYINNNVYTTDKYAIVNPGNMAQNGGHYIDKPHEHAIETTLFTNILIVPYDVVCSYNDKYIKCVENNSEEHSATTIPVANNMVSAAPIITDTSHTIAHPTNLYSSKFFPEIHPEGYQIGEYDFDIHKTHSQNVLQKLDKELKEEDGCRAKTFYRRLLNIEIRGDGTSESYILGDADGDIVRLYLLAIQSGHIILSEEAQDALVKLMNLAAFHLGNTSMGDRSGYRKSKEVNDLLDILMSKSTYVRNCPNRLICVGDIIHDRWSNNKSFTIKAIELFQQVGGVFNLGNHDIYVEVIWISGH